jgi:hypothetical protein
MPPQAHQVRISTAASTAAASADAGTEGIEFWTSSVNQVDEVSCLLVLTTQI